MRNVRLWQGLLGVERAVNVGVLDRFRGRGAAVVLASSAQVAPLASMSG